MSKSNVMYLRKRKEMMDPETGELFDADVFIRLWSGDRKFVKVFDAFLSDIIMDKELSGKPIRLLFYLVSRLPFNQDTIHIDKGQVAEELQVTERTVYLWINVLLKKGILKKTRSRNLYQVRPYAFVRGSMSKTLKMDR